MNSATAEVPTRDPDEGHGAGAASSRPRLAWFRPTSADWVFLVLVIVQTARQNMLDDPGLGWHLRNVDAMRQEGVWLTHDPFSRSPDGAPRTWLTNQWLGEWPRWLGERWAGPEGIAAVAALLLAFTLRCLFGMLLRDGLPWPVAVCWTALAALGTSCSWVARPNLFTMLFVLVTARVLEQSHTGNLSPGRTLWLLPLFAAWANIHGGFVAGFLMLGAALGIEAALAVFALEQATRRGARRRAVHVGLLTGGAFLATLLNPYGLSLYHWVFHLLGDPFFMDLHQKWRSPDRQTGQTRQAGTLEQPRPSQGQPSKELNITSIIGPNRWLACRFARTPRFLPLHGLRPIRVLMFNSYGQDGYSASPFPQECCRTKSQGQLP
jgi:hypothetical protein